MNCPLADRPLIAALLVAACLAWPAPASAQLDTTRSALTLRAGPDHAFPQVTRLTSGANVHVFGCVEGPQRWCDIQSGRARGFVPASELSQSTRVRNAPAIAFSVAEYWQAHYRRRAWFASLDRWQGWGTPGFVPPAPAGRTS
ncbi:MAG: SH3 domain-containing protein [Burkholderiales bacterium]|nr:SH3 domain-containing protein [Burkholderiales bacterium]